MEYRLATISDLETVSQMIADAVEEMESHGIDQWDALYPTKADLSADIEKGTLFLALKDGIPGAMYVISTECDDAYDRVKWASPTDTACVLHRFCVSPAFQNRGIGKEVLNHVEEQLKSMGYASLRLDVFTKNPFALRLYRGHGYETRGWADWRKGRFELMEKML